MEEQNENMNTPEVYAYDWMDSDEVRKKQVAVWKHLLDQQAAAVEKAEEQGGEVEEIQSPSCEEILAICENFSDQDLHDFMAIRQLDGSEWEEYRHPTYEEYEKATGRKLRLKPRE